MGGDELIRVLDHLLERLNLSLDLFQVCKVGLQQQFQLLMVAKIPAKIFSK